MSITYQVGATLPPVEFGPLKRMDIAYMAVAMCDPNPVHTEDDFAQEAGLPSVIGHGTFVMALCGMAVTQAVGIEAVRQLDVRLTQPVFPGDTLTATARISAVDEGGGELTADLVAEKADGTVVGSGRARFTIPPGQSDA